MVRCEKCGKRLIGEENIFELIIYLNKKSDENPLGTLIERDTSTPPRVIYLCETCYNKFREWLNKESDIDG